MAGRGVVDELWILGGVLVAVGILRAVAGTAWFKGWVGELKVRFGLRWLLDHDQYRIINDVTIPTEDGTTQIDHVVLGPNGVFVLETKNMSGWIFGREREANWTQQIYRNKQRFQNPLRQNYKHTQTLIESLGLRPEVVKPIIAFVGGAKLRTEMPPHVTTGWDYIGYIRSHKDAVLTADEVDELMHRIDSLRLAPGLKTHLQHVEHVQEIRRRQAG